MYINSNTGQEQPEGLQINYSKGEEDLYFRLKREIQWAHVVLLLAAVLYKHWQFTRACLPELSGAEMGIAECEG